MFVLFTYKSYIIIFNHILYDLCTHYIMAIDGATPVKKRHTKSKSAVKPKSAVKTKSKIQPKRIIKKKPVIKKKKYSGDRDDCDDIIGGAKKSTSTSPSLLQLQRG